MYEEQEDAFFYITVGNENYEQPPLSDVDAEAVKEGIVKGIYRFSSSQSERKGRRVHLLGSGAIMNEVLRAQSMLGEEYGVAADIWSVTSYKELYRDAVDTDRWNVRHPLDDPRVPYLTQTLADVDGLFVAVSDYVKALPETVSRWLPGPMISLGTDGFGRSDSRQALRDFFEIDHRHIVLAALAGLARDRKIRGKTVSDAMKKMEIDPDKVNPFSL
jgi:pyruvate dehydrogenase E1 component